MTIATGSSIARSSRTAPPRRWFTHTVDGRPVRTATAVSPLIALAQPPTECTADPANATLYAISDGRLLSNGMNVMGATVMPVAVSNSGTLSVESPFATDATTPMQWSGGDEVDISGILYDPLDSAVVISSSAGYEAYATATGAKVAFRLLGCPAANFGYDPSNDQVWSPTYNQSCGPALLTGNLATQTSMFALSSEPPSLEIPDSGAIDLSTQLAVAPEQGPPLVHLVALGQAVENPESGTFTAPSATSKLSVSSVQDYIPEVAVDSGAHLAFFTGAYRSTDLCVAALSVTGSAPSVSNYVYANFPDTPDGNGFEEPYEPRAVATFDLGGNNYGLTFNVSDSYIAIVDLQKLLSAPRNPSDAHAVSPSYDLLANGVIAYVPI